jgi:putative methyltransferase (TIGR01177 family)
MMPNNASRFFCVIGGKYPQLARDEISALFRTYGSSKIEYCSDNLIIAEGNCEIEKVAQRVAYTKYIAQEIQTEDDYCILRGKTFSCSATNDITERERVVEDIKKKTGARVSVKNPDYQIAIISYRINSSPFFTSLIGIRIPQPKIDWTNRLVLKRKFLHPSMLEPRICRAMVNLSMVKEGDLIVDPFCGTGGILMEAQELKIRTLGFDILNDMCIGAKQNQLENIVISNALHMPLKPFTADAIITDIPYGRTTKLIKGQTRAKMIEVFINNVRTVVKRMVIMCQREDEDIISESMLNMKINTCHLYRHKSLTRSIVTTRAW